MEEFSNSCSSVMPRKAALYSFSGVCDCAAGLGLGLLKTCLRSLCYSAFVWMVTSETFSLAGKLNKLCLKNQTGTGGYLMFGIVNKWCWIYILSKIFVSFLLLQSTNSDIRVGLRLLNVPGHKRGAAVWFGQAAICWLANSNRSNSWAL